MEMRIWATSPLQSRVKYESNSNENRAFYCEAANLNFATAEEECVEYGYRTNKSRVSRQDPLSHRIIEKRRRDRMNNCLADLSRLIPSEYLKKDRGRVEKTEIIEMAIKHMKHLQCMNDYRFGYQECMSETMRFMVDVEGGHYPHEPMCAQLLGHLQKHCDHICRTSTDFRAKRESSGAQDIDKHEIQETPGLPQEQLTNGYKYKNDIKLRFTQAQDNAKKPKLMDRRTSTPTSVDNQTCSSIGSPITLQIMDTATTPQELDRIMQPGWSYSDSLHSSNPQRMQFEVKGHDQSMVNCSQNQTGNRLNFHVPAFVLHAKGSFYVPITLDYQTVLPYLGHQDILHSLPQQDVVLHPIAINVHFHHAQSVQQPLDMQTTSVNNLSKFAN